MAAEALNAAVQNGSIEKVKQLLDEGAEINSKVDAGGWTALHCAVQNEREEIVHLLLDRGADPLIRKDNGATPFIVAGIVGSVELLELLLSKGSNVNEHDVNGFTAFMETSWYGKEDALRFLYSCGADVNLGRAVDDEKRALNKGGATALMDAARNGHIAIVKILVEEMNADVDICDNQGRNALVHALSVTESIKWDQDKEAVVLFLLKHGADVNKRDEYRKTTLILATERQSQDLVKAILEKDEVDVNATDDGHETALCVAVKNKNHEIARILCEHGARTDIESQYLIARARRLYDRKMVALLQDFGAIVVPRNSCAQKQLTIPSKCWMSKLQQLQQNYVDIGKLQINRRDYFRIQGTSQGGVYLGFYDGGAVAVKIFRAGTENAEREKTCLEKCRTSNHLVKFYGWEERKACLYLCLSLCEQNLEEYLGVKENATMTSKDILEGIFQAVQELHKFGFGHQDLHPRNILIDVTGKVLLADFDKSRKLADDEKDLIIREDVKALERLVVYVAMRGESRFEDLPTQCPAEVTDYKELEDLRANLSNFDESIPVSELGGLMCHPYFWSKQIKYRFLRDIGNESDIKTRNTKNENPDSVLLKALNCERDPFKDWRRLINEEFLASMEDPFDERDKKKKNRPKKIYENCVTDLLKLIRNAAEHLKEKKPEIQEIIKNPEDYFLRTFPDLPIYVYQQLRNTEYKKYFPHI